MDAQSLLKEQIDQLYHEMYQKLFIYAKSALGDFSLAEEAVQDTFCIACAKSDDLLKSSNPEGWLMKTLKYVVCNTARQRAKMGQLAIQSLNTEETVLFATYDEENIDTLYGDLAIREDFQIFKRIVLDRYSMREAAEEFGITVDACKKRVQRIRKVLYKKFFGENEK